MKSATSASSVEYTATFAPNFDASGLLACVTVDAATGEVLMLAYMNEAALRRSIETRQAWYWSRSRRELWRKGASSGQTQTIVEMRVDCDQDALLLKVDVGGDGSACHTGNRSCFYRKVEIGRGLGRATTLSMND
jgi:phosphoribosyl-AMP cyclohydrolase